ncbi:hypothetical protein CSUI_008433 [Cystoisospora suis]|uniref:Secreted protein n=1 Tax=Cystoisospora suis TaxID=483139 RepID=A0A2C6KMQ4_9APIC|nr:hypothetical protein CSUI_008433 [Cystoisospora suis]
MPLSSHLFVICTFVLVQCCCDRLVSGLSSAFAVSSSRLSVSSFPVSSKSSLLSRNLFAMAPPSVEPAARISRALYARHSTMKCSAGCRSADVAPALYGSCASSSNFSSSVARNRHNTAAVFSSAGRRSLSAGGAEKAFPSMFVPGHHVRPPGAWIRTACRPLLSSRLSVEGSTGWGHITAAKHPPRAESQARRFSAGLPACKKIRAPDLLVAFSGRPLSRCLSTCSGTSRSSPWRCGGGHGITELRGVGGLMMESWMAGGGTQFRRMLCFNACAVQIPHPTKREKGGEDAVACTDR